DDGSGGGVFAWTYRNKGDYDQNGLVAISDLTPLGSHLGASSSDSDWLSSSQVADGDGNGLISISDITPIGANFQGSVDGYDLEQTTTPAVEASWTQTVHVAFSTGHSTPANALKQFGAGVGAPGQPLSFRVRATSGSVHGPASNVVTFGAVPVAPTV